MKAGNTHQPILPKDLAKWKKSIGVSRTQRVVVDADVLNRFAAVTEIELNAEQQWPKLGHWALFLDPTERDQIDHDGHLKRGGFLPPIHLPRRMFASSDLYFDRDLVLGWPADCTSTVTSIQHKRGSTGDLVFVGVERVVTQRDIFCIREKQTIVYRSEGKPTRPVLMGEPKKPDGEIWCPNAIDLFRFSAVTFNGHRIHYDFPYANVEEGYPDLVVQGPFTAVKLLEYARRMSVRPIRRFTFRSVAPLFVYQPITLVRIDFSSFIARRCDGVTAMTADIEF